MMGLASLLVATAGAWTCVPNGCSGCSYLDGSSKTYRILASDFTTAEIAEIDAGALAAACTDVSLDDSYVRVVGTSVEFADGQTLQLSEIGTP
jgi:hypothetical protein